ncbi:MAG: DUF3368 domain-containing protein [Candidatus Sumerlaeia bacterium]|nr:DUF3368 domain-containing protein [Candidatus Sumerlaeia bacterium]
MSQPIDEFGSDNLRELNNNRVAFVGATPLVYLHVCDQLALLKAFYPQVITSTEAAGEVTAHQAEGLKAPDLASLPWLKIRDLNREEPPSPDRVSRANMGLLRAALEHEPSIAIVEGRHVRRVAQQMKCRATGTVGLLLMARQEGLIPSVADVLLRLDGTGFPFTRRMLTSTLLLCGESNRLGELLPLTNGR